MALHIGTSFVINSDGLTHKSFASVGINTNSEFVGIITASDGAAGDNFGNSVAVGSGRIVVGADGRDIGGVQSAGAVYIFDLDGNQLGILTAFDGVLADDLFGNSVAVGNGRIVVGASRDNVPESTSEFNKAGSVFMYDLNGNNAVKITASDSSGAAEFGSSVAVGNNRIVVGAPEKNVGRGAAYIFDLDGNEVGIITASDGANNDNFGNSVAVGNNRIVVGSPENDIGSNANQGSAYIFDLDGNEVGIITASNGAANDFFGESVAVGSGRIVVGAPFADGVGFNANQGFVYIFDLYGNQVGIISASDGANNDYFGYSVAVGNGRIVVGAYGNNIGFNANQGSAYIFDLDGNEVGIITASDGATDDNFGNSVAVGNNRIVVGAQEDDNNGSNSGSAYIWKTNETLSDYYDEIVDHYRY